jgi:uncharacterized membrane protein YvbJ
MSNRIKTFTRRSSVILVVLLVVAISNRGCTNTGKKADEQQLTFSSPDDAVKAFVTALRSGDKAELEKLFGPDNEELLSSGDECAGLGQLLRLVNRRDVPQHLALLG